MNERKKPGGFQKAAVVLLALILVLNILACFKGFCNFYKSTFYPGIADFWGRILGVLPVAAGELLMYLGALLLSLALVFSILLLFLRKRRGYRRFAVNYLKAVLLTAESVLLIYTLNWVIPFRSDILEAGDGTERDYTLEEVRNVRNDIVLRLNECAEAVERDESGRVIYYDVDNAVFQAMQDLQETYPLLGGYYPPMKGALCSDFLEWMDIGGYTYPYTMEVTYNVYVTDLYYPFLLAHESSHHKGYYQENEANFIAFLACTGSEDPLVRYAGYNEIYYYINDAYYETLYAMKDAAAAEEELRQQPQISEKVYKDRMDARKVSEQKYEAVSHPAQDFAPAAADVAEVGWSVQGEVLQGNSYDGVVKMLLQYYDAQEGGIAALKEKLADRLQGAT